MPLSIGNSIGIPFSRRSGGGGFVGLLDEVPGAAFAASVRLLRYAYSGGLVRVIAYDGSTQFGAADIMPYRIGDEYFLALDSTLENLDATAIGRGLTTSDTLADLCSVGVNNYDGIVPKIYRQSILGGSDYEQTNISRMGILIDAGILNVENGKPIIKKGSGNESGYLASSYDFIGDTNIYGSYFVVKAPDSNVLLSIFLAN